MAPVIQFQDKEVKWRPRNASYNSNLIATQSIGVDASNTDSIAAESIIVRESDGNAALQSAGGNVLGIVRKVLTPDNYPFRELYKPTSVAAQLEYMWIGDIQINCVEDGDGGVIADWVATPYVNLTAQSLEGATGLTGAAIARGIRALRTIDSSTASASTTSRAWQIVALDDTFINFRAPGDTTAVQRYWLTPIAANQQTQ